MSSRLRSSRQLRDGIRNRNPQRSEDVSKDISRKKNIRARDANEIHDTHERIAERSDQIARRLYEDGAMARSLRAPSRQLRIAAGKTRPARLMHTDAVLSQPSTTFTYGP